MPDRLTAAVSAVKRACVVCRHVQRQQGRLQAMTKDDRSPVTIADFASQAVVAKTLRDALGDGLVLVGEEDAAFLRQPGHEAHLHATLVALRETGVWPDGSLDEATLLETIDLGAGDPLAPAANQGFWTLDPIDGTKGFIRGGQYAVCLAFIEGSSPTIGVLGCPNLSADPNAALDVADATGTVFRAEAGIGAQVVIERFALGVGRLENVSRPPILAESVESAHSDQSVSATIMRTLAPDYGIVRLDSQCKYAVVARGQADVYLRLPTKKGYVERIWDHAAGALIAAEAGCAVSDIHGRPLDFSKGRGLEANRGIVVAPPPLHTKIMGAIAAIGL